MEGDFSTIIQQAAAIKSQQLSVDRRRYDSYPEWYQHSMFYSSSSQDARPKTAGGAESDGDAQIIGDSDPVVAARAMPKLADRIRAAEGMKLQGNGRYAEGDFIGASNAYTCALAVFKWLENTDPGWKKKALDDKDIQEHAFSPALVPDRRTAREVASLRAADAPDGGRSTTTHDKDDRADDETDDFDPFLVRCAQDVMVSCLLNLSLVYQSQGRWREAVRACSEALELQPRCAKAMYRRAQALATPASSGMSEYLDALTDLRAAAALEPADPAIRRMLASLSEDVRKQREKDNKRFKGFLSTAAAAGAHDPESEKDTLSKPAAVGRNNFSYVDQELEASRSCLTEDNGVSFDRLDTSGSSRSAPRGGGMTVEDAYRQFRDMESAAQRAHEDGDEARAEELRQRVRDLKAQVDAFAAEAKRQRVQPDGKGGNSVDFDAGRSELQGNLSGQITDADAFSKENVASAAKSNSNNEPADMSRAIHIAEDVASEFSYRELKVMLRRRGVRCKPSDLSASLQGAKCDPDNDLYALSRQLRDRSNLAETISEYMCSWLPSGIVRAWLPEKEQLAVRRLFVQSFASDMHAMRNATNAAAISSEDDGNDSGNSSSDKNMNRSNCTTDNGSERLLELYGLPTSNMDPLAKREASPRWSWASVAAFVSNHPVRLGVIVWLVLVLVPSLLRRAVRFPSPA